MSGRESANVARFLAIRAREQPEGISVKAPMGRDENEAIRYEALSFAELHAQSEQLAHLLVSKGIVRGTRVLLMVKPGSDLIRCCFALLKTGAVPVVIDPGMGLKHFLKCVQRSHPESILGIPLAQWISRFFPKAFKSVKTRLSVGRRFSAQYGQQPMGGFTIAEPGPEELAAILFTSGSTGAPKGVRYGHGQFVNSIFLSQVGGDTDEG